MTSQAAVDLLIKKGRLEPQTALAVAEAIDTAMSESQLVTVPILDARLAELKADTQVSLMRLEGELGKKIERVDSKVDVLGASFETKLGALGASFDTKLGALGASFDTKLELLAANLEKKMEAFKAELVRWVFGTMVGCTTVAIAALVVRDLIQHSH
jgi:hypothetical protein